MIEFTLIDNLADEDVKNKIARAIILGQVQHENSWDGKKYTVSFNDVASAIVRKEQLPEFWISVLVYLLEHAWNDSSEWAKNRL